jgi:hypothetical protein
MFVQQAFPFINWDILKSQLIPYLWYPFVAGILVGSDLSAHQDGHDTNSRILLDDIIPPLFPLLSLMFLRFMPHLILAQPQLIAHCHG